MTRLAFALLALLVSAPGCVLRTLEVRSTPAGATVYLDDTEVGVTPLDLPFDFYGTRDIRVAKQGYRPHQGEVALGAPWYEWIPFDFVSEVLWPGTIRDRHAYAVTLEPIPAPDETVAGTTDEEDAFLARAERRLLESRVGGYVRRITMEIEVLESRRVAAGSAAQRGAYDARLDRIRSALVALPGVNSLAGMAHWERAHRAAVLNPPGPPPK